MASSNKTGNQASSSSSSTSPSSSSAIANSAINLLSTLITSPISSSSPSSSSATALTNSLSSSQSTKASSSSSSSIPHQTQPCDLSYQPPPLRSTRSRPNFRSSPSPLQASWSIDEYEPEREFTSFYNSDNYTSSPSTLYTYLQPTNNNSINDINTIIPNNTDHHHLSTDILAAQLQDGMAVLSLLATSMDEQGHCYYDEVESMPSLDVWAEMERNYHTERTGNELELDLGLELSLRLNVAEDPVEWLMMTGPGGEYTEQVWVEKEPENVVVQDMKEEEEVPASSRKGKERAVERSPVVLKSRM